MALVTRAFSKFYPSARSNIPILNHLKITFDRPSYVLISERGVKRFVRPLRNALKKRKDAMDPQPPSPRNTYAEWNYNSEMFAFGKRLGEDFNKDILQQAFIERSYIIMEEEKQKNVGIDDPKILLKDNREFSAMGESLIIEYSKRFLRTVYPRFPEEGICSICDYLVSDDVLADISMNLGIRDLILSSEYPPSNTTLANVFKAVIYALEQSSGQDRVNLFIRDFVISYLSGKDINELWQIKDAENVLATILLKEGRSPAEPRLVGDAGKNTILAAFRVGLYSDKELIGIGFGESIPIAKEMAALDSLKRMFRTTESAKPLPFDLVLPSSKKEPFANVSIQDWCEKNVKTLVTK